MTFNQQNAWSMQDMIDEYAGMLSEDVAIASILGNETESHEDEAINRKPTANYLRNPPNHYQDPTSSFTLTKVMDKVPFELWSEILNEFLPPCGTTLQVSRRSFDQTNFRLPYEYTRLLSPLFLVSKRFTASIISMILGRCLVLIRHDSVITSANLLQRSRYMNSPEVGCGFGHIRKMEIKWTPMTIWDGKEMEKFFKLLSKATGLQELKIYIPYTWWGPHRELIWKRQLRMILTNARNLPSIELWRYEKKRNMHTGWYTFLSKGASVWIEVRAGQMDREPHVDRCQNSIYTRH